MTGAGGVVKGWLYDAAEFLSVQDHKIVARWADHLFARPVVARGRKVNRTSGAPSSQLRERHDASEFDTRTQDKLMGEQALTSPASASSSPAGQAASASRWRRYCWRRGRKWRSADAARKSSPKPCDPCRPGAPRSTAL